MRGGAGRAHAARRGSATRRIARWLPGLLILGGLAVNLLTPIEVTGSPFFSAAPLVAAPLFTLRATVAAALTAGFCVLGLNIAEGTMGRASSITELVTVGTVGVLSLLINRVVRRSGKQLASARDIAEAAQRAVLPTPHGRIGGLHIAARYEAAVADARIGGDLYAVQETPHGVRMIVGDVRGKGLEAVEAVAIVIGAFREAAEQEWTLEAVAERLERALQREDSRREGLDRFEGFTTAVLAEISPDREKLRLLNRGHPPPLLLFADGEVRCADPAAPALPLGMGELGVWPDRADEYAFASGATLLLFTDGVTEARNHAGVFYEPAERLRGRLFPGPDELLDDVLEDVARHTGGPAADDMALLAVSRPGERQPDRRRTVGLNHGSHWAAGPFPANGRGRSTGPRTAAEPDTAAGSAAGS